MVAPALATLPLGSRVIYGTLATLPLGSRVIYGTFATPAFCDPGFIVACYGYDFGEKVLLKF